jgi:hypothetical protein
VLIKRLLQFDGEVTVLDEIWLPDEVLRGLTLERLADDKGPLYAMFETEFGTRMIRASEKIRAVTADPGVAGTAARAGRFPAALGGARVLYLRRPTGRSAPWLVCHNRVLLSERFELRQRATACANHAPGHRNALLLPLP